MTPHFVSDTDDVLIVRQNIIIAVLVLIHGNRVEKRERG